MTSELSASCVEQAVHQFYQNAGSQQQQQIQQWLTLTQISPEAWSFCWELLSPEKTVEVKFYGANTLYAKISRYWAEVPPEQYDNLRSRLLQKIMELCSGDKIVTTRLCISLACLILHMTPEEWPDPVPQLISTFQSLQNVTEVQRCQVLLEILRVLPEEFFSANLSQSRRLVLKNELLKSLSHVIPLLQSLLLPGAPSEIQKSVLQCFSSWLDLGSLFREAESIILQTFQCLHNPDLFDTAVETLVNIFTHPSCERYQNTMKKYLSCVLGLQDTFMKARDSMDMDVCQRVGQIIISYAENNISLLLEWAISPETRETTTNFINLVLTCTAIPGHFPVDENFSNMFFTFWYLLQDGIQDSPTDRSKVLHQMFCPVFLSLIQTLLVKVQYPEEEEYNSWTKDEKEQFRCYRQDIGDTMMYSYSILREPLLGFMCNTLNSAAENPKEAQWQLIEAIFFLFSSVAENVDLEEEVHIPSMLSVLPKLPFNNIKYISGALKMIGSFSEWINCHPESLNSVIPLILQGLQGLQNGEIAESATMSLKDVTAENLDHIQPYAPQILGSCQHAFQSGLLKTRDSMRLMHSVGQVLSVMKYEEIMQYLTDLLSPLIQQLQNLVTQEPSTPVKASILSRLAILGSLFSSLDTDRDREEGPQKVKVKPKSTSPKPVAVLLQQLAPIIQSLLANWINDPGIIEGVCDMFKHALRTLLDDFALLSKDVAEMLVQMYQVNPSPAILDLAKQLIIMHHEDPQLNTVVTALLGNICTVTLELFTKGPQDYTDVIEAFMNLLSQVLKKSKSVLTTEQCVLQISSLFHSALQALSLPEHQTVKATCSFLAKFLSAGETTPVIKALVQEEGSLLLDKILRAVGGEAARGLVENLSDVFLMINKHYPENMPVWMNQLMKQEGYPSPKVSQEDKEVFIKGILREKINKRKIREVSKEFSLKCRGLFGTEYAANTGF
ncbi:importin-13-like [Saccostrea echinata]|uniref:importin-13-like n=1 Tax=Saccostrea echinata TaxID=191078 RepID=UPI002A83225F|nr:importin-13-like [Saccostrea echinata]XP_061192505.1 importin-13-like [Saccostrea echinata]